MQIKPLSKISIQGVNLEFQTLHTQAQQSPGPTLVFLHEGLGSIAMWRDWPSRLCQQLGCAGLVYSRQGYGQSDPVADVRAVSPRKKGWVRRASWSGATPGPRSRNLMRTVLSLTRAPISTSALSVPGVRP